MCPDDIKILMRIGFVVPKKVCGFEHRVPYTWQLPWLSVSVKIITDPIPPPLINLGHIVYKCRLLCGGLNLGAT